MVREEQVVEEEIKKLIWAEPYMLNRFGDYGHPMSINPRRALMPDYWFEVDRLIHEASLEMCLTSKYLYIRECKKWFVNKEKG